MSQWRVRRKGSPVIGPFTEQEVLDAIRQGKVPSDSEVCLAGTEEWRPIGSTSPFQSHFGSATGTSSSGPLAAGTPATVKAPKAGSSLGGRVAPGVLLVLAAVVYFAVLHTPARWVSTLDDIRHGGGPQPKSRTSTSADYGSDVSLMFGLSFTQGPELGVWEFDFEHAIFLSASSFGPAELVTKTQKGTYWVITGGPFDGAVFYDAPFGEVSALYSYFRVCDAEVRPKWLIAAPPDVCAKARGRMLGKGQ